MRNRLGYIASTTVFSLLAVLFLGVLVTSLGKNVVDICVRVGLDWRHTGNYVGLFAGFAAYVIFAISLLVLRMNHHIVLPFFIYDLFAFFKFP